MQSAEKTSRKNQKNNDDQHDVFEPDFVPYACHYDTHTLLTKNGELLQTIKITGIGSTSLNKQRIKMRELIRQAIAQHLPSDDYALWLHSIRRRYDITPEGAYPQGFASQWHQAWAEHQAWKQQYANEVYITIVRDGQSMNILEPQQFMHALWPPANRKFRENYLAHSHAELDRVTSGIVSMLEPFGARKLGIIETRDRVTSEVIEFLGKILNLGETSLAIPIVDLSEYLPAKDVTFGYNVMEVKGVNGRNFGAILNIKEYKELSDQSLDSILQLPQEFIISQCVDFIARDTVKSSYQKLHDALNLSGDEDLARLSGLKDILGGDQGRPIDYGRHQLSILLFESTPAALEASVARSVQALAALGIVSVREDVRLEDSYWSLLPGNFEFVCRHTPINLGRIGGFSALQHFATGKALENQWGAAVTLLKTANGTPYYFNFHVEANGNTLMAGGKASGKTLLANMLCLEACKFDGRVFYFDRHRGAEIALRALGGSYHRWTNAAAPALNPLQLADQEESLPFLMEWVWSLLTATGEETDEEELHALQQSLAQLALLPTDQRRLANISELLTQHGHQRLSQLLAPWHGEGAHASIFDHAGEDIAWAHKHLGFDMASLHETTPTALAPVMLYLLYRTSVMLDGTPTIIVLEDAWTLAKTEMIGSKIAPWLASLPEHQALAILTTENNAIITENPYSTEILSQIATAFHFSDTNAEYNYPDAFGLNEREKRLLSRIQPEKRHVMLKQGSDMMVIEWDMRPLTAMLHMLSATPKRLAIFDKTLTEKGTRPEDWVEAYQQTCLKEIKRR
jgi:type IV secretion system protein VirB4